MWLARSLPPLLCRLRRPTSAHRGGSLRLARKSSRSYASAGGAPAATGTWPPQLCDCCGANQQRRRRHLYMALDDWEKGLSLYKLSLEDLFGSSDNDAGVEPRRLPDPILRLRFLMVGSHPRFHALGTNIVVTSCFDHFGVRDEHGGGLTLVYDTETAAVDNENSLPRELFGHYHAIAAGDRLYTFNPCNNGGMLYLCQTEQVVCRYGSVGGENDDVPYCFRPQQRWTWKSGPAPPPPLSNRSDRSYVWARAVHPDGRTIFVSLRSSAYGEELGTFSLDMASGAWTRHGDWCLPFKGQGHYDDDLGAWVGTHTVYDEVDHSHNKHLCSCDVPEIGDGGTTPVPAPAWKVAEEKLTFLEAPLKSMHSQVLIPMRSTGDDACGHGAGGMFCLIERTPPQGVTLRRWIGDGSDKWLLRVTMFRAKYGKNGELVTVPLRSGCSFLVPRYVANYDVSAFWM